MEREKGEKKKECGIIFHSAINDEVLCEVHAEIENYGCKALCRSVKGIMPPTSFFQFIHS